MKIKIIKMLPEDIRIFITYDKKEVTGFNFHYGANDDDSGEGYEKPSKFLWKIYKMLAEMEQEWDEFDKSFPNVYSSSLIQYTQIERVKKSIDIYIQNFMWYGHKED